MELLADLLTDTVRGLASSPVVEVAPAESIGATIQAMRAQRSGCALVIEGGRLRGIFTERDVLTRVLTKDVAATEPITSVMTPDPVTVRPDDSVAEVVRRLHAGGHRNLPVVDGQGGLVTVVSVKAVVCYLVERFPRAIYSLPPDPAQIQTAREGA